MPALSATQALLCLIPAVAVVLILQRWSLNSGEATYGLLRMVVQLVLVGYALSYVVLADTRLLTLAVLIVMVFFACWIALRPLRRRTARRFIGVLFGICVGAVFSILFIFSVVLRIPPLESPLLLIPLAGMAFASAMNTVSLTLERYESEILQGTSSDHARVIAYRAGLIPTINSLFAIGIVSMPGTMTGQIISGVSPHIAARYQILVMGMLFGASGISAALALAWMAKFDAAEDDAKLAAASSRTFAE